MSEPKTRPTGASVTAFLDGVEDENKRQDSYAILQLMRDVSGEEPQMWGDSIVGFGTYHYRYASGREGVSPLIGFSPRKRNLTLYITYHFELFEDLLNRLGKHKTSKACLYINRLSDVDQDVLRDLVRQSIKHMQETNP